MKRPRIYYGWFILAIAFLTATMGYSMRYSFAVFYPEILDEFGWTRAETALAYSLNLVVYGISSPIIGTLVDRFVWLAAPRRVRLIGKHK